MTNRDWFCLALRLFGIWLLLQSTQDVVPYLLYLVSFNGMGQGGYYWISVVILFITRIATGLLLLLFAPAITTRFHGNSQSTPAVNLAAETSPLKVGIQLLAVYAILLAVQSGAGILLGFLSGESLSAGFNVSYGGMTNGYVESLLNCGLNLAFAFMLIIWNEQAIIFLEKLRYVPDRDAYEQPPLDD